MPKIKIKSYKPTFRLKMNFITLLMKKEGRKLMKHEKRSISRSLQGIKMNKELTLQQKIEME